MQVYIHDHESAPRRPAQEREGCDTITVNPGAAAEVRLLLGEDVFRYYHPDSGGWLLETGNVSDPAGGSSCDVRLPGQTGFQKCQQAPDSLPPGTADEIPGPTDSTLKHSTQIREWHNVGVDQFHSEIVPLNQPAVMRSLVNDWPAVAAAARSVDDAVDYLKSFDGGVAMYTIVGSPEIKRRFFYGDKLRGTNFQRTQATLTTVLDNLVGLKDRPDPHAIAIQAGSIREALPGFERDNSLPLLPESVAPTLWLSNSAVVAPHYDVHDNVACVVAGKRRFTLFPPDQVANLYVGPTLDAPGGVPISMVDLAEPDLERFPRFAEALAVAQEATLYPGDAVFIPTPWWHAVESLDAINVLVNYWWGGLNEGSLSPNHSLLHAMLTIANLSPAQRASWRHFFDYFVFKTSGDPAEHLPGDLNDIVTKLSPEQRRSVYQFLIDRLK